ncbi:hypothetical protein CC2G_002504 [Coprinopsis cinerea AmutBmut pab1-1]|nr:hypothetical protein CC2G_002504 [Coprinopsis cinerea AmutBmut pab1-1]KAG2006165.1 hypothetical protein CC2G_002504 [Coprinopsis cinerea AmutBmut pab1-1]
MDQVRSWFWQRPRSLIQRSVDAALTTIPAVPRAIGRVFRSNRSARQSPPSTPSRRARKRARSDSPLTQEQASQGSSRQEPVESEAAAQSSPSRLLPTRTPSATTTTLIRKTTHPNQPAIYSLPHDVLGEIFYFYIHGTGSKKKRKVGVTTHRWQYETPLVLGMVCRPWRQVTHAYASLWSTIQVTYPRTKDVPQLAHWLKMSRTCLLDITVLQHRKSTGVDVGLRETLKEVMAHGPRWKYVAFKLTNMEAPPGEDELATLAVETPELLEFSLGLPAPSSSVVANENLNFCKFLYTAPKLKSILFGRGLRPSISSIQENAAFWEKLEHASFYTLSMREVLTLLSTCKSLTSFFVYDLVQPFLDSDEIGERVVHPMLRSLTFTAVMSLDHLLDRVTLPALTDLKLAAGFGCPPAQGWKSLKNLFERSECTLKSLDYRDDWEGNNEPIIAYHLGSPKLYGVTHLTIHNIVKDITLQYLTISTKDGRHPLPNLEVLNLPCVSAADGVLERMVRTRLEVEDPKFQELNAVVMINLDDTIEDLAARLATDPDGSKRAERLKAMVKRDLGMGEEFPHVRFNVQVDPHCLNPPRLWRGRLV